MSNGSNGLGKLLASMGAVIANGGKILVVVTNKEARNNAFFKAMSTLLGSNSLQVTLIEGSRTDVTTAMEEKANSSGILVMNGDIMTPHDQGYLASQKHLGTLPVTIIVTERDPGDLMDRDERSGSWTKNFVIKEVDRAFHWLVQASLQPTAQQLTN